MKKSNIKPCVKCCNSSEHKRHESETPLIVYGIFTNHTFRYHHGKRSNEPQCNTDKVEEELLTKWEELEDDS